MAERILQRYRALLASGELAPDPAQEKAAARLQALEAALREYSPWGLFSRAESPKGLYLWGDVGRGKSMLMDLFFSRTPLRGKRRVHFNSFMVETHARLHEARQHGADDPIPAVAKRIADEAVLLCFDEFQVTDVADAMILGRLFERLFWMGVVVVATSNVAPTRLYESGLNRQLFLPFIALIEQNLDILELYGPTDYRLQRISHFDTYITPLGPEAETRMDAAWLRLTNAAQGEEKLLIVLGRKVRVPQAAKGVARFTFDDLCGQPLSAVDYLEIARQFHTLLIDRVPALGRAERDEARRFITLVDTIYDTNVKLICSAAVPPDQLYREGDGAKAFRRTASRLMEMQSLEYLRRGHSASVDAVETLAAQA